MTVEEIYKNRDKFSQEVQRVASQDLAKMGLDYRFIHDQRCS